MRSVNKVILIGNATRNAELRHTSTGKAVSNIRLATNRVVNGPETTQFHTVICRDKLAEITSQYVKKGIRSMSKVGSTTAPSRTVIGLSAVPSRSSRMTCSSSADVGAKECRIRL